MAFRAQQSCVCTLWRAVVSAQHLVCSDTTASHRVLRKTSYDRKSENQKRASRRQAFVLCERCEGESEVTGVSQSMPADSCNILYETLTSRICDID
eukprot:389787-Amphidinium_carterae.1